MTTFDVGLGCLAMVVATPSPPSSSGLTRGSISTASAVRRGWRRRRRRLPMPASKKNSLAIMPARASRAYNTPASVAGVLRETFAGRREPALPVRTVTCGEAGRGESHGCGTGNLGLRPIKPPPGSHAGSGLAVQVAGSLERRSQRKPRSGARRSPVGAGSPEQTPKATRMRSHSSNYPNEVPHSCGLSSRRNSFHSTGRQRSRE
jgi:hypothetical protein